MKSAFLNEFSFVNVENGLQKANLKTMIHLGRCVANEGRDSNSLESLGS